ncbi:MAG: DUF2061 domain-containing protein [Candidatus Berkelbacteria bacterium]|nr:DUF2061 domain-containing protein [Candidatus Berkelbacteria bacterium]
MAETSARSLTKAISWRIFATIATVIIVYVFTGELILSLGVGLADILIKLVLYYFHERIWNCVKFGRVGEKSDGQKRTPY